MYKTFEQNYKNPSGCQAKRNFNQNPSVALEFLTLGEPK